MNRCQFVIGAHDNDGTATHIVRGRGLNSKRYFACRKHAFQRRDEGFPICEIGQIDMFPAPTGKPKRKRITGRRLRPEDFVEWTDPVTAEVHRCPREYFNKVREHVGLGPENALLAAPLLRKVGKPVNESEMRHLRQAVFLLRRHHVPIVSLRSQKGGYFIATAYDQIESYVVEQEKIAQSMMREAEHLRKVAAWKLDERKG